MVQLLPPSSSDKDRKWKIWTLSTWILHFKGLEEDQERLKEASLKHDIADGGDIHVDTLIIGAGNA